MAERGVPTFAGGVGEGIDAGDCSTSGQPNRLAVRVNDPPGGVGDFGPIQTGRTTSFVTATPD